MNRKLLKLMALSIFGMLITTHAAADLFKIHSGKSVMFVEIDVEEDEVEDFYGLKGSVEYSPTQDKITALNIDIDLTKIQKDNDGGVDLRGPEFFDVANYPVMHLGVSKLTKNVAQLSVTVKNVTKIISFDLDYGSVVTEEGHQQLGVVLTGQVDPKAFGLHFPPDSGVNTVQLVLHLVTVQS